MNQVVHIGLTGLNHVGRVFCDYAGGIFVQSAVLVSVLLIMDWFVRKRVRAVFRYCVWMLVLVKLILPPTLALPTGIGYWLGDRLPAAFPLTDRAGHENGLEPANRYPSTGSGLSLEAPQVQPPAKASGTEGPVTSTASGMTPITWQGILFLLWFIGVIVFAALLVQRLQFVKGLIAFSTPTDRRFQHIMEECGRQVGIHQEIGLRASNTMSSPAICGLLRPIVLVPARILETLSPDGLKAVLIHELAHMKRGDLWINTLQTLLQVIHFYNPFVWLANTMIRRTREEAVDETVLVALGGQAKDYSNTLIDIGEMALWKADLGLRLIGVAESEKILRWRIKHMLTRPIPKSAKLGVMGTVVLIVMAAMLLPMACVQRSGPDSNLTTQPETESRLGRGNNVPSSPQRNVVGDGNLFIDPKTGITFRKVKAIAGSNDIVQGAWTWYLKLSANGKFLLTGGLRVIPLDDEKPVGKLVDDSSFYPFEGYWSQDGKKVAFYSGQWPEQTIWVVGVDPDTQQPMGPPKKLVEGLHLSVPVWLPDSERLVLWRPDGPNRNAWTVSINDGTLTQVTDLSSVGIPSPDGENIAYSESSTSPSKGLWVKNTKGGPSRRIADGGDPAGWSPDGRWVYCRGSFIRIADGYKADITPPSEVGHPLRCPSSWEVKTLYFYNPSYDDKQLCEIAPISGGPICEPGRIGMDIDPWQGGPAWSPDGQTIIVHGCKGNDTNLWALPLAGGPPIPFKTDIYGEGQEHLFKFTRFSPDFKSLLGATPKGYDPNSQITAFDVWVLPVSWQEMRSIGPEVSIFKGLKSYIDDQAPGFWSPDGKQIALADRGSIYTIRATGGDPVQLVKGDNAPGEAIAWLDWSPDGKIILFHRRDGKAIQAVPSSGGEPKTVCSEAPKYTDFGGGCCWAPDSQSIIIVKRHQAVLSVSTVDGSTRTLVNLRDLDIDIAYGLRFSPDGKILAFTWEPSLFLLHMENGKVDKLRIEEPDNLQWSPDSKWVAYYRRSFVKTRPESVLWEMDVEEALAKLAK